MFSALPKLLDRQFIFGYLLPVIVFALCAAAALQPWKDVQALATAMFAEKDLGGLALTLGALWLAAAALMLLNRLLQRFVAGYAWPFTDWWGKTRLLERWSREVHWINREADRIATFPDPPNRLQEAEIAAHNERLFNFRRTFPRERGQVLGTLYGNAVRAYERYPNAVYGVDGVALRPRLSGVISKDFQSQLGDARAQVDCFVNLSLLAVLLALVVGWTLVTDLWRQPPQLAWIALGHGAWIVGVALAARLFYTLAIERAVAEGELVRAAFDLFLPRLAPALGFSLPDTRAAQAELLDDVKRSSLYHLSQQRPWAPSPPPPPPGGGAADPPEPSGD